MLGQTKYMDDKWVVAMNARLKLLFDSDLDRKMIF